MLLLMLMPGVQASREVARAMPARAMWHLGEARPMQAWEDLFAVHRLSRLMGRDGQMLVEQLVGIAIAEIAYDTTVTLLDRAQLTPADAHRIATEIESLTEFRGIAASLATWERLWTLDGALHIRNNPVQVGRDLEFVDEKSEITVKLLHSLSYDWNLVLRRINGRFDEMAAAANAPTRDARVLATEEFDKSMDNIMPSFTARRWLHSLVSRSQRSEVLADVLSGLAVPTPTAAFASEDRANAQLELLRTAAALAVYRAENGLYPEKLNALVPSVLPTVPVDLFHGNPFVYRREGEGYFLYTLGANATDDGGSNRSMRTFQGRRSDDFSDDEWQQIESQIPADSDDYSIRLPRKTIEPPRTPAEAGQ
jgi:hypothetical protein